jgi:hypothetical protein
MLDLSIVFCKRLPEGLLFGCLLAKFALLLNYDFGDETTLS